MARPASADSLPFAESHGAGPSPPSNYRCDGDQLCTVIVCGRPNHNSHSAVTMGCTSSKAFPESHDIEQKSRPHKPKEKQVSLEQKSDGGLATPAPAAVSTATNNKSQAASLFPGAGQRLDSGPPKVYSSNSGGRIYAPGDPNHPSRRPVSNTFRKKHAHHYNPAIEIPQRIIVSSCFPPISRSDGGLVRLKGYPFNAQAVDKMWGELKCLQIIGRCWESARNPNQAMATMAHGPHRWLAQIFFSIVYKLNAEC